jgi:hypothetical protein
MLVKPWKLLGFAAGATVGAATVRDYRRWRSLGEGGVPANAIGYVMVSLLCLVKREPLSTKPYDAMKSDPYNQSWISALPTRHGTRPSIDPHPIPQRQVDQHGANDVMAQTQKLFDRTVAAHSGLKYARSGFETRRHARRASRRSCHRTRHPRRDRSHSSHRRFDAHGLQPTRRHPGAQRRLGRTTRLGRPGKASTHLSDGLRAPRRQRSCRCRTIARRLSVIHEPNRALRQQRSDLEQRTPCSMLGETSAVSRRTTVQSAIDHHSSVPRYRQQHVTVSLRELVKWSVGDPGW